MAGEGKGDPCRGSMVPGFRFILVWMAVGACGCGLNGAFLLLRPWSMSEQAFYIFGPHHIYASVDTSYTNLEDGFM